MLLPRSKGHLHRDAAAFTVSLGCPLLLPFLRPSRLCKRITSRSPPAKSIRDSIRNWQTLPKSQDLSYLGVLLLENSNFSHDARLACLIVIKKRHLAISTSTDHCPEGQAEPRESQVDCVLYSLLFNSITAKLNSIFSTHIGNQTRCISLCAYQSQQQIVDRLLLPSFAVRSADALLVCLTRIPPGPVSSSYLYSHWE